MFERFIVLSQLFLFNMGPADACFNEYCLNAQALSIKGCTMLEIVTACLCRIALGVIQYIINGFEL